MTNVFLLPAKYRIDKTLSKEFFIQKANLTNREAQELVKFINEVTIQYVIEFNDKSQLIFLEVVIDCYYEQHTFQNVASIIASAIPQNIITIIRYQERVKVAAFNSRTNLRNSYRKAINNYSCSPYFLLESTDRHDRYAIDRIENAVYSCSSADECNKRIISVIEEWKENHFEKRRKIRRGLYSRDRIAQLDLFYEFEQEDKALTYDSDYYFIPDEGYENMSFEEKNYLYHFLMHNVKEDEELRKVLEESFLMDSYLFDMEDEE